VTTTDAPTGTTTPGTAAASTPAAGLGDGGWRTEALLLVEVAALAAFAFSRPVLDSFGRSPETFIARNADTAAIVWFGLIVSFVPALVLGALGAATRVLGPARRRWAHIGLVGLLGGVVVWRLGQDVTGWPGDATKLILAGVLAVPLAGALRWRLPALGTFLRYAGVASLLFLGQFLFTSPVASLVLGDGAELDDDVAAAVAGQLGDDAPDVVFVVFDALPVESLLDGTGHIDAATFPNFARVADAGTWYRNNTSNAIYTGFSVPAILTGRLPETRPADRYRPDPENLFTLLGGSYDVQAAEQVTNLCPEDVCVPSATPGVGPLLGDAAELWWDGAAQADDAGGSDVPGALETERYAEAEQWIAGIEERDGDRPRLVFQHIMLPHGPFAVTDDGTRYATLSEQPTGQFGPVWTEGGTEVGRQRHLLQTQAADRLLGQILARLDADDAFDDTLIVVTADHGEAFMTGEPDRQLSEANADKIAWAPLVIKAPGQREGRIDDANVQSVDIVPTVADLLGVELPWDVDGIPAGRAAAERGDTKPIADYTRGELSDAGELDHVQLDGPALFAEVLAADAVEHDGPEGVWQRTAHGELVGREVADLDIVDPGGAPPDGGDPAAGAGRLAVERLADLEAGDGDPPLIEVVGHTELPEGTVVAYALDGRVAALTEVGPGGRDDTNMAHALLPPALLGDGGSELTAYRVTGEVGHEVLRPLAVDAA
jgi:hypothetical protein